MCVCVCVCVSHHVIWFLFVCLGNAVLTYFGKWDFVEDQVNLEMARRFYMAPGKSRTYMCVCVRVSSCV